jgi:hypothetical protein
MVFYIAEIYNVMFLRSCIAEIHSAKSVREGVSRCLFDASIGGF